MKIGEFSVLGVGHKQDSPVTRLLLPGEYKTGLEKLKVINDDNDDDAGDHGHDDDDGDYEMAEREDADNDDDDHHDDDEDLWQICKESESENWEDVSEDCAARCSRTAYKLSSL